MTFGSERYPADWKTRIVPEILARAGNRCECTGECGSEHPVQCKAPNGAFIKRSQQDPSAWRLHNTHGGECLNEHCPAVRVVLTVAHLDHDESNNDPSNLRALCQRCHLQLDREDNARRARAAKAARRAVGELPGIGAIK